MSFDEVDPAAEEWLAEFGLPPVPAAGGKDLRGREVRVCAFATEDDLRFFFPRRTVPFHQRMVKHVTAALRRRGCKIMRVQLDAEVYARWLDAQEDKTDTPARRYQYATRPPHL